MSKIIAKESIMRLLKDVKQVIQNPLTDNGIYYVHDDTEMLQGYAMIVGPSDTPYFGGFYFFKLKYPTDYPHSPPSVTYCTNGDGIRFNPNLYKCGKVCVSLLNTWRGEQWTSCQTISTVLLTLCTLLCKDPLLNEPGVVKGHPDFLKYDKIIEYKNIDVAIIQMFQKKSGVYQEEFEMFYPYLRENFLKNKEKVLEFLKARASDVSRKEILTTGLYSMNVSIDYSKLLESFSEILKTELL
jgi:ubiquitin-conjugating enzyme E2 Z